MNKRASEGALPSEACLFPVCGLFCGQRQKPKFKLSKIVVKSKKTPAFYAKSGCFVELLGGFEPPTSSLPTDWEDRVCCFQTLLHPLHSGVPSFPELLCPLSPSARFPVWVSVWVKGRREPAIAPPAQPDCYQSASPHRLRERLRASPLSSNSVSRTPSAALALQ